MKIKGRIRFWSLLLQHTEYWLKKDLGLSSYMPPWVWRISECYRKNSWNHNSCPLVFFLKKDSCATPNYLSFKCHILTPGTDQWVPRLLEWVSIWSPGHRPSAHDVTHGKLFTLPSVGFQAWFQQTKIVRPFENHRLSSSKRRKGIEDARSGGKRWPSP